MTGAKFKLSDASDGLGQNNRAHVLTEFNCAGPAMVGVVRIPKEDAEGFWERHDHGDEILIVLEGRMTFTIDSLNDDGNRFDVGPGDMLFIPKGRAHSSVIHDACVQLVFITPRDGNASWSDDPNKSARH